MNKALTNNNAPRASSSGCCSEQDCGPSLKNNYFEGKQLTPDSFRVEQQYLVERRRLLNRAIHGWGVVYGYRVRKVGGALLEIEPGVALDQCGRELLQTSTLKLPLANVIVLDGNGQESTFADAVTQGAGGVWLLEAHYAEQSTDPVHVFDACRCEHVEWDHVCETVRYTLRNVLPDDCCAERPCELECECSEPSCLCKDAPNDPQKPPKAQEKPYEAASASTKPPRARGGAACLCEHLSQLAFQAADLCELNEACGKVRVDLGHGVPLACMKLVAAVGNCGDWALGETLDACGPRRLVKRNDLLFDLIRGCDLTRIKRVGWENWHDKDVSFDDFSDGMGDPGQAQDQYLTKSFWVEFTKPVQASTLRAECFAMTILSREAEGGWWQPLRVPIVGVNTTTVAPEPKDPPHHVRSAKIIVDGAWVEDGLRGRRTVFDHGDVHVELEVRGDLILDCNGQAVDANAVELSVEPTGNGTPGGSYLTTFRVKQRDLSPRKTPTTPVAKDDRGA